MHLGLMRYKYAAVEGRTGLGKTSFSIPAITLSEFQITGEGFIWAFPNERLRDEACEGAKKVFDKVEVTRDGVTRKLKAAVYDETKPKDEALKDIEGADVVFITLKG
ncbi:hypothetical protein COT98_03525, partial [Candidatus Falkowbacteria bacterium CG10_big_fil_rev_8_21_14_0_10_39_9]